MPEPVDYEKCKTSLLGLYLTLALIYIILLLGIGKIRSDIKAMQPCRQVEVTK